MAQYRVEYKAYDDPEIARGITEQEFLEAMDSAEKYGFINLDPQSVALRNFYRHRRASGMFLKPGDFPCFEPNKNI